MSELGTAMSKGEEGLQELWNSLPRGQRAARLVVAHYLAEQQDNIEKEVAWDEQAAAYIDHVTNDDLQALHSTLTVHSIVPSLQLNLADGYRRLLRFDDAQQALERSLEFNAELPTETPDQQAYKDLILEGQKTLKTKLNGETTPVG